MEKMSATTRPVRIHIAMEDGPIPRAIKQVLPLVGNESSHIYAESMNDADLIIFREFRNIEQGFNKGKSYAYLEDTSVKKIVNMPDNCAIINPMAILQGLITAIGEARKKLTEIATVTPKSVEEIVSHQPNALRVLVIDDAPENIESAKTGLTRQNLTLVTGYESAMNVLATKMFDVVLTDLHLPMSSKTMGDKFKLGELVPYGLLLMVEAARRGAMRVAVVTDLSHHDDPFSAAFDHFSGFSVNINNAEVIMMHAPMKDGAKDWAAAFDRLMKT